MDSGRSRLKRTAGNTLLLVQAVAIGNIVCVHKVLKQDQAIFPIESLRVSCSGFALNYFDDGMTPAEKITRMKSKSQVELYHHLVEPSIPIREARTEFSADCAKIEQAVAEGGQKPLPYGKRKRRDGPEPEEGLVARYWKRMFVYLPTLSFVAAGILSKCSASEAAAERMFSKEGFVHDDLRNRLAPSLVESIVRINQNWAEYAGSAHTRVIAENGITDNDLEIVE